MYYIYYIYMYYIYVLYICVYYIYMYYIYMYYIYICIIYIYVLYIYMNCEPYLLHNAIDGVFLPRSPVDRITKDTLSTYNRSRGVPTSFYKLNMMFLTNPGTPEYYFPYTQIRAVAHIAQSNQHSRPGPSLGSQIFRSDSTHS